MYPFLFAQTQNPMCVTLQKLRENNPIAIRKEVPHTMRLLNNGPKESRDTYSNIPYSRYSENFIVRWGTDPMVEVEEIDNLLVFLEASWNVYINEMGHVPPPSSVDYLINVYIGDSGGNTPSTYGAGGYYSEDIQGYPMLVVSKDVLGDYEFLQITAAHEFYHAIQGVSNRYSYEPDNVGSWVWESTATWASGVVYPNNYYVASFLPAYVLLSHLPVNYFLYPENWVLEEYYQYGSFLFPQHLTEYVVTEDFIRRVWEDESDETDPFEVMNTIMQEEEEISLYQVWMEHNSYMTNLDYQQHDNYEYFIDYYEPEYPEYNRISHIIDSFDEWDEVSEERKLQHLGFHRITLDLFSNYTNEEVEIEFEFDFDEIGSNGRVPHFMATLVEKNDGISQYHVLIEDSQQEEPIIRKKVQKNSYLDLIVGVWSENGRTFSEETFGYHVRLQSLSELTDDTNSNLSDKETNSSNDYTGIVEKEPKSGCQSVSIPHQKNHETQTHETQTRETQKKGGYLFFVFSLLLTYVTRIRR